VSYLNTLFLRHFTHKIESSADACCYVYIDTLYDKSSRTVREIANRALVVDD
jgi:RNA:NAD 2'-phosphotransferase (TPT1/KptA family)